MDIKNITRRLKLIGGIKFDNLDWDIKREKSKSSMADYDFFQIIHKMVKIWEEEKDTCSESDDELCQLCIDSLNFLYDNLDNEHLDELLELYDLLS